MVGPRNLEVRKPPEVSILCRGEGVWGANRILDQVSRNPSPKRWIADGRSGDQGSNPCPGGFLLPPLLVILSPFKVQPWLQQTQGALLSLVHVFCPLSPVSLAVSPSSGPAALPAASLFRDPIR